MPICDKNCFACPFPDCINDEMDADDYAEARGRDKLLQCPTGQGRRPDRTVEEQRRERMDRKNACNRAWYAKNRESILTALRERRESDPEYVAQRKAYRRAHYQANRAEILDRQKAYYLAHREECLARSKAYYEANRARVGEKNRTYNESHRAERLATNRAYRDAHRDEINAKRRGNPRIKEQHRSYYLRNREEILARQKEYDRRRAAEKRAARERAEPREDHCRIAGAIPKGNQK